MQQFLVFFILLFSSNEFLFAQSNCPTFPLPPINIINNPSFENSLNYCATSYPKYLAVVAPYWYNLNKDLQMVYLHSCSGYIVNDSIIYAAFNKNANQLTDPQIINFYPVVPLPVPDGNGVIGFIDTPKAPNSPGDSLFHKSYVATCLTESLKKDSLYQLQFYVGFGKRSTQHSVFEEYCEPQPCTATFVPDAGVSPSPVQLSLFGLASCPNFSLQKNIYGCLVRTGWTELGTCTVSGDIGKWVKININFKPSFEIKSIAIGPSCDTTKIKTTGTFYPYEYFLDNLQLYESTVSSTSVNISSGSVCSKSVTLQVSPMSAYANSAKQWFKNGASLSGETQNTLNINELNYGEGYYQCRVQNDSVCLMSDSFAVHWQVTPLASVFNNNDTILCKGDTLVLNAYTDPSSTYHWQDGSALPAFTVKQAGIYTVNISNACGSVSVSKKVDYKLCDDSIFVPTAFTPNGDGRNDIFRAKYFYTPEQFSMNIYNRYGERIFASTNISEGWDGTYKGKLQPVGSFICIVKYKTISGKIISLKGTVTLIK